MMSAGNLTQKQIAEKFGCSVAALTLWRKETKNKPSANDDDEWESDEWDDESEEDATESCDCCCAANRTKTASHDIIRQFWNKNFRAVDMLLTPKDVCSEEVVKLVNEALQYACEHFQE